MVGRFGLDFTCMFTLNHSRNAPNVLGMRAIVFPIAAGNTLVLKGSELSPRSFYVLGKVLTVAGLPPGVLNIIYHRPQDAAELTEVIIGYPAAKKINFTGSTNIGSIIASVAGKHLKPVVMELGGKASAIVLDDADIEKAALQSALGAFLHVSGLHNFEATTDAMTTYRLARSACPLKESWFKAPSCQYSEKP